MDSAANPCFLAFWEDLALPSSVRGPVLLVFVDMRMFDLSEGFALGDPSLTLRVPVGHGGYGRERCGK